MTHLDHHLASVQIKQLQEQSFTMSIKLRNRKAAESHLGQFVEDLTVPPKLISNILESDVRSCWRPEASGGHSDVKLGWQVPPPFSVLAA